MVHYRYPPATRVQRKSLRNHFLTAALVAISICPVAFYTKFQAQDTPPLGELSTPSVSAAPQEVAEITVDGDGWSPVAPVLTLKPEALALAINAPLETTFKPFNAPRPVAGPTAPVPSRTSEPVQPQEPAPEPQMAQIARPVPLPVPRPSEFRVVKASVSPKPEAARVARAPVTGPVQGTAAPSAPDDNPSFLEKLFGIKPSRPPGNALSYAALGTGDLAPSSRIDPMAGDGTAVYDISAKVVIMPNGERLEAHSGLGDKLDDPRFVHVRMQGATPPGTYTLTEREALFHGVRAIRLNPVGGSAAIYGRNGILAHSYLLGPNGDSNGCVSFKNYDRFLQAFLRGEVKRLIVVAGRSQDALPRMVNRGRTS
ncbi:MAG TPA: tlde1 domain-containing protein [Microvirga sp.]|nr:tlde1 domain-containing protein [Microvirga sp.]